MDDIDLLGPPARALLNTDFVQGAFNVVRGGPGSGCHPEPGYIYPPLPAAIYQSINDRQS